MSLSFINSHNRTAYYAAYRETNMSNLNSVILGSSLMKEEQITIKNSSVKQI